MVNRIFLAAAAAVVMGSCGGDRGSKAAAGTEGAAREARSADFSLASPSGLQAIRSGAEITGVVLAQAVWSNPDIQVCWETMDPADADGRRWTQQAVEDSWESASRADFVGWGACGSNSPGVHIQIADEVAQTEVLGSLLDGMRNGMRLNFRMNNWNRGCRAASGLEACVRIVAIHEFGHALGLAHEQNRPETREVAGDDCARRASGTVGDRPLTPWDPESVMNYCNRVSGNGGRLSVRDISSVQQLYGLPIR